MGGDSRFLDSAGSSAFADDPAALEMTGDADDAAALEMTREADDAAALQMTAEALEMTREALGMTGLLDSSDGEAGDEAVEEQVVEEGDGQAGNQACGHERAPVINVTPH